MLYLYINKKPLSWGYFDSVAEARDYLAELKQNGVVVRHWRIATIDQTVMQSPE